MTHTSGVNAIAKFPTEFSPGIASIVCAAWIFLGFVEFVNTSASLSRSGADN